MVVPPHQLRKEIVCPSLILFGSLIIIIITIMMIIIMIVSVVVVPSWDAPSSWLIIIPKVSSLARCKAQNIQVSISWDSRPSLYMDKKTFKIYDHRNPEQLEVH